MPVRFGDGHRFVSNEVNVVSRKKRKKKTLCACVRACVCECVCVNLKAQLCECVSRDVTPTPNRTEAPEWTGLARGRGPRVSYLCAAVLASRIPAPCIQERTGVMPVGSGSSFMVRAPLGRPS